MKYQKIFLLKWNRIWEILCVYATQTQLHDHFSRFIPCPHLLTQSPIPCPLNIDILEQLSAGLVEDPDIHILKKHSREFWGRTCYSF